MIDFIKKTAKIILYFSPEWIRGKFKMWNEIRVIKQAKFNRNTIVTKVELENILKSIDFNNDVFFHTSLMDIGKVEGGYLEVINLINKYIYKNNNTILFSALPFKGSSENYLKNLKVFDVKSAPVMTGVINEYYSSLPDSKRSLSPTHSVVALGENADYYTKEHHLSKTPFSEKSPYFKLVLRRGKILMFGASLNHLTFYHVIEDLMGDLYPFNDIYTKEYFIDICDFLNERQTLPFKAHKSFRSLFKDFKFNKELKKLDSTIIYKLGCSELILLNSRDVILFLLKSLNNGNTLYGKTKISEECRNQSMKWIRYFDNI